MPNWCFGDITVKGPRKRLEELDAMYKRDTVTFIQIHNDEDMKECVDNGYEIIGDCGRNGKIAFGKVETGYSFSNFVPETKESSMDWYTWRNENWGTKWNADIDSAYFFEDETDDGEFLMSYSFSTAWSPCTPVVIAMSKAFPDLLFNYVYSESGMQFAGRVVVINGNIIVEEDYDDSLSFRTFCRDNDMEEFVSECPCCGLPLYEYELEDEEEDDECPNCDSSILALKKEYREANKH